MFGNQKDKLTSLFQLNLTPNLENLKMCIPKDKIF